jgi:histone H3/H4
MWNRIRDAFESKQPNPIKKTQQEESRKRPPPKLPPPQTKEHREELKKKKMVKTYKMEPLITFHTMNRLVRQTMADLNYEAPFRLEKGVVERLQSVAESRIHDMLVKCDDLLQKRKGKVITPDDMDFIKRNCYKNSPC